MVKVRKRCIVTDCPEQARARGLCNKHLKRWQKHGHTNRTRPEDWGRREKHPLYGIWTWRRRKQTGTLCEAWYKDFWLFVSDVGDSPGKNFKLRRPDRGKPYSKDNAEWVEVKVKKYRTESDRDYNRRRQKIFRKSASGKKSIKNSSLKKTFGITLQQYTTMLESQKGVCAICGKPETSIHHVTKNIRDMAVDHCHTTNKIRGLLCSQCNTGLGCFKDSTKLLYAAVDYLAANNTGAGN